jgi:hyperosmotically inducible periplasmic protein
MLQSRSILATASTALFIAACGSTPMRESTGEYLDDSVISAKVKTAFIQDKQVDAADINVKTFKGVVQLSGFTDSPAEMRLAVDLARQVPGVKSVQNNISVKPIQQQ